MTHKHTKCAPAFDPVAKIGVSDGGKISILLAVELFAVAPEIFKRRESNAIKKIARLARTEMRGEVLARVYARALVLPCFRSY